MKHGLCNELGITILLFPCFSILQLRVYMHLSRFPRSMRYLMLISRTGKEKVSTEGWGLIPTIWIFLKIIKDVWSQKKVGVSHIPRPPLTINIETIEILVIEGASGILDFLLYSHCTQWPDQKFYPKGGS